MLHVRRYVTGDLLTKLFNLFPSSGQSLRCLAGNFTKDWDTWLSRPATPGQRRHGLGGDRLPLEALQHDADLIPRLLRAFGQPAASRLTSDNLAPFLLACLSKVAGQLTQWAAALRAVRAVCAALAALLRASPVAVRRRCTTHPVNGFTWPVAAAGIREVRPVHEGHPPDVCGV